MEPEITTEQKTAIEAALENILRGLFIRSREGASIVVTAFTCFRIAEELVLGKTQFQLVGFVGGLRMYDAGLRDVLFVSDDAVVAEGVRAGVEQHISDMTLPLTVTGIIKAMKQFDEDRYGDDFVPSVSQSVQSEVPVTQEIAEPTPIVAPKPTTKTAALAQTETTKTEQVTATDAPALDVATKTE